MIKPSKIIGVDYLSRWHIIPRNRWFNIYLHKFTGSDDDRALHDHPWHSVSFLLKGELVEVFRTPPGPPKRIGYIASSRYIRRWLPIFRSATFTHRLVVIDGPVWTLFITGHRIREWGFWCPKGWVHWKKFTDSTGLRSGAGCGEE